MLIATRSQKNRERIQLALALELPEELRQERPSGLLPVRWERQLAWSPAQLPVGWRAKVWLKRSTQRWKMATGKKTIQNSHISISRSPTTPIGPLIEPVTRVTSVIPAKPMSRQNGVFNVITRKRGGVRVWVGTRRSLRHAMPGIASKRLFLATPTVTGVNIVVG